MTDHDDGHIDAGPSLRKYHSKQEKKIKHEVCLAGFCPWGFKELDTTEVIKYTHILHLLPF